MGEQIWLFLCSKKRLKKGVAIRYFSSDFVVSWGVNWFNPLANSLWTDNKHIKYSAFLRLKNTLNDSIFLRLKNIVSFPICFFAYQNNLIVLRCFLMAIETDIAVFKVMNQDFASWIDLMGRTLLAGKTRWCSYLLLLRCMFCIQICNQFSEASDEDAKNIKADRKKLERMNWFSEDTLQIRFVTDSMIFSLQ